MITKFDMASGELAYQAKRKDTIEIASKHAELINQTPALQLIEVVIQAQPKAMPPDLASVSIEQFLDHQG